MRRKRRAALCIVLLSFVLGPTLSAQPPTSQDESPSAQRAREVRRSNTYPVDIVLPPASREDGQLESEPGNRARKRTRKALDRGVDPAARQEPQSLNCGGAPGLGPGFGYMCLAVSGVLLLAAIIFGIASWLRNRSPHEMASVPDVGGVPQPEFFDPLLEGRIEDHAALAREGRYREAIRALFLLMLGRLVDLGSSHVRSSTARELVADLRHQALVQLLQLTEIVWWGGRDAGLEDYQRALAWAGQIAPSAAANGVRV